MNGTSDPTEAFWRATETCDVRDVAAYVIAALVPFGEDAVDAAAHAAVVAGMAEEEVAELVEMAGAA